MKLKDIVDFASTLDKEWLEADFLIDTEAAEYSVHLAEVESVEALSEDSMGRKVVAVNIDNCVKIHKPESRQKALLSVTSAFLVGSCPVCGEPTTGQYDSGERADTYLECVSCKHKENIRNIIQTGIIEW